MISAETINRRPNWGVPSAVAFGLMFSAGFIFSVWLLSVYTGGDQYHYDKYWRAAATTNWWNWADLQTDYLGSADYLYGIIVGLGTYSGIDRVYFISIFNGLLIALTGIILRKNRAHWLFCIFMMTNFYFLVLLGPAERLKFAYLLLALSVCLRRTAPSLAALAAAPLCHTQSLFQIGATSIYYVAKNRTRLFKNKLSLALFTVMTLALSTAAGYLIYVNAGDVLAQKSEIYGSRSRGIIEALQWFLVAIAGLMVFRNRIPFIIAMIPLGIFTAMYGNRVNIATLVFFCWVALNECKTGNTVVLLLMAYMSFKSIGFIVNVISAGQGFV